MVLANRPIECVQINRACPEIREERIDLRLDALGTYDIIVAHPYEAGLLFLAGSAAMILHEPHFFARLGPNRI